jgi:elongation factor G
VGEEKAFRGIVDLVAGKAHVYGDDASGKFQVTDVPAAQKDVAPPGARSSWRWWRRATRSSWRSSSRRGPSPGAAREGPRQGVAAGRICPVLPASPLLNAGVHALLDAIVDLLPSPADRGEAKGTDPATKAEAARRPAADAPFSAFVWKTMVDPHAGRISALPRLLRHAEVRLRVHNASRDAAERVGSLLLLQGKAQTQIPEIQAGDIGAVAKLKDTMTGDTLADKASADRLPGRDFPEPATTFAIEPKTRGDEDKISTALQRLQEEDPVLRVSRDPQTHEMLLSGMGSSTWRSWSGACASATRSR